MGHNNFITIWVFGEMITKPISDMHHYTLSYYKSLSLMKSIIISKMYMWITLWITMWISGVCVYNLLRLGYIFPGYQKRASELLQKEMAIPNRCFGVLALIPHMPLSLITDTLYFFLCVTIL